MCDLLLGTVQAQYPPTEWIEKAQSASCADLVKASMTIVNDSKTRFDVFWMNEKTKALQQINTEPVEYRQVNPYNSYVDQYMELHEIPDDDSGECMSKDQVCRRAYVKLASDVNTESKFM